MIIEQELDLETFKKDADAIAEAETMYKHTDLVLAVEKALADLKEGYTAYLEKKRGEWRASKSFTEKQNRHTILKNRELGYKVATSKFDGEVTIYPFSKWLTVQKWEMIKKHGFQRMIEFYTALGKTYTT